MRASSEGKRCRKQAGEVKTWKQQAKGKEKKKKIKEMTRDYGKLPSSMIKKRVNGMMEMEIR